ncbi:MAG: hypothetical protein AB7J28_15440 [Hyphomonadaceae bacterium]
MSIENRRAAAGYWRKVYYSGQAGDEPPKYNKCFTHIERLGSYLYSAADVRFSIDFNHDDQDKWPVVTVAAARKFNRDFKRSKAGVKFGNGLRSSLIYGCSLAKQRWKNKRAMPTIIRPQFFGVLREDVESLDDQDAFCEHYYLTKAQFRRLLVANGKSEADVATLMARVETSFSQTGEEAMEDTYFHEIVAGGVQPITSTGTPSGNWAQVGVFQNGINPMLAPEVQTDLIKVTDLWVWNDSTEDYSTFRFAHPDLLIEGGKRMRSLSDVPGEHPYTKICPNEVDGYFWGRSELAGLAGMQALLNRRINDVDRIFALQSNPPTVWAGFSGIDEEKKRAMLSAGGQIANDNPQATVNPVAPNMPDNALPYIEKIERWFDEMAGFTPALLGEADAGVRSSQQGNILIRTGAPPIRERAFIVETQLIDFGDKFLNMERAKDARTFTVPKVPGGMMLSQLPEDAAVDVDSHTASPAFSGDHVNLAFAMRKAGAIDNSDLLRTVNFPNADSLAAKSDQRAEQQAKFIAEHPEILGKRKPGPKPGMAA